MLAPGRDISVVSDDQVWVPSEIDGQPLSSPRWLALPTSAGNGRLHITWPRRLARQMIDRALRFRIQRALQQQPPVLAIHNGFPIPGSINAEILERSPSKLIVVHSSPESLDFFARRKPNWTRAWVSGRLRGADSLMFVTPQIRDTWSDIARLNDVETFVVPNTTREDEAQRVLAMSRNE